MIDPIIARLKGELDLRAHRGFEKYGTTLAREDLSMKQWLQHTKEELLDAAAYIERIIVGLENAERAAGAAPDYPQREFGFR